MWTRHSMCFVFDGLCTLRYTRQEVRNTCLTSLSFSSHSFVHPHPLTPSWQRTKTQTILMTIHPRSPGCHLIFRMRMKIMCSLYHPHLLPINLVTRLLPLPSTPAPNVKTNATTMSAARGTKCKSIHEHVQEIATQDCTQRLKATKVKEQEKTVHSQVKSQVKNTLEMVKMEYSWWEAEAVPAWAVYTGEADWP